MADLKKKQGWTWRPPRVRSEPPTIQEAMAAAHDLTGNYDQQIEIAASLMGLPASTVRSEVGAAPRSPRMESRISRRGRSDGGTLIVERKIRRGAASQR